MVLQVYLHFFCFFVDCHDTHLCSLYQPDRVSFSVVKCMDFHDNLYCFSIFTWQTFHVILLHIGVPCHGSLMT